MDFQNLIFPDGGIFKNVDRCEFEIRANTITWVTDSGQTFQAFIIGQKSNNLICEYLD